MIVGLGVDLAEVSRLRAAIERRGEAFLHRVFTEREIAAVKIMAAVVGKALAELI